MVSNHKSNGKVTPELVADALDSRFPQGEISLFVLETSDLIDFLSAFELTDEHHAEIRARSNLLPNLLAQLELQHPDSCISDREYAVLAFLDECAGQLAAEARLDHELQLLILNTFPALMRAVITDGLVKTLQGPSILSILDQISLHCIGWTGDLGRAGKTLYTKVESVLEAACQAGADYVSIDADLASYFEKEQSRVLKLEERVAESEAGILRVQRAQHLAATTLNRQLTDMQVPSSLNRFLKGPWSDTLQFLLIHHGERSAEWETACKLTDDLVWSMQPIKGRDEEGKQRLYKLTEELPAAIRALLSDLEYGNESVEAALQELETEHVNIISGQKIEYEAFSPLEGEDEMFTSLTQVSHSLLGQVEHLAPGQWFLFERRDGQITRIKLALKLDDVHQLLFTNYTGIKALQKGFEKFAYFISSNVARPLRTHPTLLSRVKGNLKAALDEYDDQQQRLASAGSPEQRASIEHEIGRQRAIAEAKAAAKRRKATQRHREEAERREQLKQARVEEERAANFEKLEEMAVVVQGLHVGAWFEIPGKEGSIVEYRLAARFGEDDTFLLTNRDSVKTGEYSADDLAQLIVLGGWKLLDDGKGQLDALTNVVRRMRQDRSKGDGD